MITLLMTTTAAFSGQWLFVPANQTSTSAAEVYRYYLEDGEVPVLDATLTGDGIVDPGGATASESGGMYVINHNGCGATSATVDWFTDPFEMPTHGGTEGQMSCPHGFTWKAGSLIAAEAISAGGITVFTLNGDGSVASAESHPNVGTGSNRGIAWHPPSERLYVSQCCGNDVLHIYEEDGAGGWMQVGEVSHATLANPHGIAVAPDGELFVCNYDSGIVTRFVVADDGTVEFNGVLEENGMSGPIAIAVTRWGEILVANEWTQDISRWQLDADGVATTLLPIGSPNPTMYLSLSWMQGDGGGTTTGTTGGSTGGSTGGTTGGSGGSTGSTGGSTGGTTGGDAGDTGDDTGKGGCGCATGPAGLGGFAIPAMLLGFIRRRPRA